MVTDHAIPEANQIQQGSVEVEIVEGEEAHRIIVREAVEVEVEVIACRINSCSEEYRTQLRLEEEAADTQQ